MPFKTILTVTEPGLGNGDIETTARLCAAVDAHLTVLVVQMAPPPPIGEFAAMTSDVWLEERREDAKRLAARREELTAFTTSLAAATQVVTQYPGTDLVRRGDRSLRILCRPHGCRPRNPGQRHPC
jgi:hypothetical protein